MSGPSAPLFEAHNNPLNTSHWVAFHHHEISAVGAPGHRRLGVWNRAGVTDVVTLQRRDEMASWLPETCEHMGWRWHHFPLSGKLLLADSDDASLASLVAWSRSLVAITEPKRMVLHCSAGLHRTGVGFYVMLRGAGLSRDEALERIQHARPLTHQELTRSTRKSGRLVDGAEQKFVGL